MFSQALVRPPSLNFADGLTREDLGAPDFPKALAQHERYCEALQRCGLTLTRLPPDARFPDGTFVEDTAVLMPNCSVLTLPGAESRAGEVDAIRDALLRQGHRLVQIQAPGSVDGGDICETGDHVLIGISARTNEEGARQLAAFLADAGYTSECVDIRAIDSILHLKSGLSWLGDNRVLLIEALAGHPAFARYERIVIDADEAYAANAIRVNDHVLLAAGYPRTAERLRQAGYSLVELDMSEYRKMDGGLSCLSLRY
ncbi:dimethylarginine dimethylaminohydrolase family protein [Tahibacter amnicola]|uniref:Dimethylargininase n=1 Tax=Tahibacter amnicola TaxID=2976241 RepID=A0ABY6BKN0_9GAMM|nr:dimethylargininase [Tahibacter amnicola]UXI70425.1 dimethylargininase [Tahibacter amnicola]